MTLLCILIFLMDDFVVYNATKHLAELLSSVPECKKVVMCLWRRDMCSISSIQARVIVLLTMSSVLMNREYGTSRRTKRKFTKMYAKQLHCSDQRLKGT